MQRLALALALIAASGAAAWAEPPSSSPYPLRRPVAAAPPAVRAASLVPRVAVIAPMPRPTGLVLAAAQATAAPALALASAAPDSAPRPNPRPPQPEATVPLAAHTSTSALAPQTAAAAPPRGLAALFAPRTPRTAAGSVCGDSAITGNKIVAIPAAANGCGLSDGVSVTAVAGIALSEPATIDCNTAKALKTWVEEGVIPAIGRRGGGLAALDVVASYICRPRNNVPGAKVSEHGAGHAVDVAAFVLADGSTLSVARDWNRESKTMRAIHASACGPFGTVLGPKADANHRDHFHVDTASYRSGPYCR
ncbi:extensin family protein [Phaeovulum sp.]|uniref:extensin-like domain-containing protein n=1 Tax=Phaeovulum sp. TaxID=2934796 RepID=UPI003568AC37